MSQSDPTKESGSTLGPHQDGTISMRYGDYLDLMAERDALREVLVKIENNAETWHGDNEAKARALTVIARWCRTALESRP